jgi:hypothetical protein
MPAVADDASGAVRPDGSRLAAGPVRRGTADVRLPTASEQLR